MIFLAEALNTTSEVLDSLSPFQEYSFKRLQMTHSLMHYIISSYWNCVSGKMLGRLPLCGEAHKSPCLAKIQVQPCLNQPHRGSSCETWSSRGSNFIIMLLPPSPWSARNSNLDARKYNWYDKIFFKNTSSITVLTNIMLCTHTGGLQGSAKQNTWTLLDKEAEDG